MTHHRFKIEKNIPISNIKNLGSMFRFVDDMEVGDSVLVKTVSHVSGVRSRCSRFNPKYKVCTRRLGKDKIRIWRVE